MIKTLAPQPQKNFLLAALSPEIQGRLFPHLELVHLSLHELLYEANREMPYVYFPTDSIISLQYLMKDGESTAISVVGNEGLLGVNLCMGSDSTPNRSLVQIAGHAYRLPKVQVEDEFARHGQLMELMLCYTHCLHTQVAQTAVCNRRHSILQQLCRWLLISMDRLEHSDLTMTQGFISNMLGVRREGVTEASILLRSAGIITYQRGLIHVIDRSRLESMSCECYSAVKTETDRLLEYWPKRVLLNKTQIFLSQSLGPNLQGQQCTG